MIAVLNYKNFIVGDGVVKNFKVKIQIVVVLVVESFHRTGTVVKTLEIVLKEQGPN